MSYGLATYSSRVAARQLLTASRAFSTSAATFEQVPPESPSYIRLPTPPQSDEKKLPRVRGHLPVPREIFPRVEGDRKLQRDYLAKTAPKPSSSQKPINDSQAWKATMAKTRRSNLRGGLTELWQRRNSREKIHNERVSHKFEMNHQAVKAPERADDVLTRGTVLDGVLDTRTIADPQRFQRAEARRAKNERILSAKREARRDALMELYINASKFIVSESELKAEIDTIFAEDFFHKQGFDVGRYGSAENTWDVWGKPTSINDMLETTTGVSTKIMDFYETEYDRSVKRQKRIAEEFTGGKME
ncbi:hypothetical protein FLAG1_09481 [Fusarium langsethiae]|uniref:Uncharacterized protein n=1 Tax=Fusarium langsethiae TaxID=179993 RepID=A0A0N0DC45_FUSLA|nr:hypothetical protein FLAG1_09481 [Fusarium langsethiae]GKU05710.1 unnamed protein product [Fusarium langsethiae]GKU18001.1 unnamed protein product [Fusarium langsethiae]